MEPEGNSISGYCGSLDTKEPRNGEIVGFLSSTARACDFYKQAVGELAAYPFGLPPLIQIAS
jgi:hypothetical protein